MIFNDVNIYLSLYALFNSSFEFMPKLVHTILPLCFLPSVLFINHGIVLSAVVIVPGDL